MELKALVDSPEFGYAELATANDLVKRWLVQRGEYEPVLEVPKGAAILRDARKSILTEYLRFIQHHHLPRYAEIDDLQAMLADSDAHTAWRTLHLRIFNADTLVAKSFPDTLRAIAGAGFDCSTIMFSTLEPGKTIPPHTGFYCGVLRYHLGLVVPSGCFIDVAGQRLTWQPDLYFDDSFVHSACNPSAQKRTVLFLDVVRDLGDSTMNELNRGVLKRASKSQVVTDDVARVNETAMRP